MKSKSPPTIVDEFELGDYKINKPFLHAAFNSNDSKRITFDFNDKKLYIEYFIIFLDYDSNNNYTNKDLSKISLCVKTANNREMQMELNYVFYNRVLPFICKDLYNDTELNSLLKAMTTNQNNGLLKNLLFFPILRNKNVMALNTKFLSNIDFIIDQLKPNTTIHIYTKFKILNNNLYISSNLSTPRDYSYPSLHCDVIIEQHFNGNVSHSTDRIITLTVSRNFPCFNTFSLQFRTSRKVKNIHKLIKTIQIYIGGELFCNIPMDYVELYYKEIEKTHLNSFSSSTCAVVTVLLTKMFALFNIPLFELDYHEVRIYIMTRFIKENHNYNIERKIEKIYNYPDSEIIQTLPIELWNKIMNYLDDESFANLCMTCKFFYSFPSIKDLNKRVDKLSISNLNIDDIVLDTSAYIHGSHMNVNYKDELKRNRSTITLDNFISVQQYSVTLNNDNHIIVTQNYSNVNWIIVTINCEQKYVLSNLKIHAEFDNPKKDYLHYNSNVEKLTDTLKNTLDKPNENKYIHCIVNKHNNINKIELFFFERISGKLDMFVSERKIATYFSGMCSSRNYS